MTRKRKIVFAILSLPLLVLLAAIYLWIYVNYIWVARGFDRAKNTFQPSVLGVLTNGDSFTLYSIETLPSVPDWKGEFFHGCRVLGKNEIKDPAEQAKLISSIESSAKKSRGLVYMCFNPHHGIRSVRGTNLVDVVICFHCLSLQIYTGATNNTCSELLITDSAQGVFDKAVKDARLPVD